MAIFSIENKFVQYFNESPLMVSDHAVCLAMNS